MERIKQQDVKNHLKGKEEEPIITYYQRKTGNKIGKPSEARKYFGLTAAYTYGFAAGWKRDIPTGQKGEEWSIGFADGLISKKCIDGDIINA